MIDGDNRKMEEKTLFDIVIDYYARHRSNSSNIPLDELNSIKKTFKHQVAKDAIPWIEKEELEKARARVDEEVKSYKRKALQALKLSLVIETIFLAFLVGIVVNQVTNLIPPEGLWIAIIVSLLVSAFIVYIATLEPKE